MIADRCVLPIPASQASEAVVREHYLHRRPPISFAFGLFDEPILSPVLGVVTFGTPASRHLQVSACKGSPSLVIELNRLWCDDACKRNTESWFLSRALKKMPPRIVVSYADTSVGHIGYVYRAANFHYAGVTDQDRKTPRFDYVTAGKHSRETTRNGTLATAPRVRRKPKHRYWTVTGNRRERRYLVRICTWPTMAWKEAKR